MTMYVCIYICIPSLSRSRDYAETSTEISPTTLQPRREGSTTISITSPFPGCIAVLTTLTRSPQQPIATPTRIGKSRPTFTAISSKMVRGFGQFSYSWF